ncbi:MAG: tetratricopeptide repeat protein [Deltaproteobacteria bacterium]|nr:MAG: tetratricopeptide repeat protein [Deltaproteobacteria bacterium]
MKLKLPPRYALEGANPVLGEGGMGRVLRVRDQVLDLPVALKVIKPELAADARFAARFDLEVRIAARFTHPHIVPLHDLGSLSDGTPFLGLALADGGNLARFRQEPIGWEDLLRLVLQLLEALAHLHARGVLHRDLKPENVLLHEGDGELSVWLADLGLANAAGTLARKRGRREGTPGYMAPEQRLGLVREMGPWTDLYAVGVILWELVTGQLPFPPGRSALDAELHELVPRFPVPDGLEIVLANLLSAEPLSRYDLAADLRTELLALPPVEDEHTGPRRMGGQGTVAPSAPRPSGPRTSQVSDIGEGVADVEWSFDGKGQHVQEVDFGVPLWNRPAAPRLPRHPPPDPGLGAQARASLPLFAMRELPLVAREGARDELWTLMREVAETRQTWVVLVVGEAGSGKTALVESVARAVEEGGWAEPIRMRWHEPPGKEDGYAGAARALIRPWNETRATLESRLRRRLARSRGANDRMVQEEASTLARWAGLSHPGEEAVAAGYGLREVYRELDARSWRALSTLVLDNVHLAVEEGDGLDIAEGVLQLAAEGIDRPLLVVATLRSEAIAHDWVLASRIDALVEDGAVRIDLPRLDRQGTAELLAESLTLAPDLASQIAQRCEGNPLFARQLILEWSSRGWLVDTGGLQFGLAEGVDLDSALPSDAEALFAARVEALARASGDAKGFDQAVHMAALAGAELPEDLLIRLAPTPEIAAYMLACGLWVRSGSRLSFDHGMLQASLRARAMMRADIRGLHRHLSGAWAAYGEASGQDVVLEVGRHAHAAEAWDLAVKPLLIAATRAYRRGAIHRLQEAAELAETAAERGMPEKLGWARVWAARAAHLRGDNKAAAELYGKAFQSMEEYGDTNGALTALIGLGTALRESGHLPEADKRLNFALNRARSSGDTKAEAEALSALAWLEQKKRNFEGADLLFTRVLNRAEKAGDTRGAAHAALGQAYIARRLGRFADAEELYGEAVEGFHAGEDPHGVARAQAGLAVVKRQQLDLKTAETLFREAIQASDELGAIPLTMDARAGLADLYRMRGDYDRARTIYESCARWAERQHVFESAIFAHLSLAHLALLEDDLSKMYVHASNAAVHLRSVPGHWLWASYRLVVATLLALRDDGEETYRWLWSAHELGLGDTVDQDVAYFLTVLAHVCASKGWPNPTRIATKLAVDQWTRLGRPREAARVAKALDKVKVA